MTATLTRDLERLTSSGLELADPADDLRGRDVRDQLDAEVGIVADVLVDPTAREVRLLEIETPGIFGLGKRHYLMPLEAVATSDARTVYADRTREEMLGPAEYKPGEGDAEEAQYEAAYRHYGFPPYWERDARTPSMLRTGS